MRGWFPTRFRWRADFSDEHLAFNARAAECLEQKHLLAALVSQHCPEVMPVTYGINDENWPKVLQQVALDWHPGLVWILKPALLNNGQHIKFFQTLEELAIYYAQPQRLGGEHVLQQYIQNPHLLRDNRKYSIRMFMVLSNFSGAFVYRHGYFNVALHPYTPMDFSDSRPHLTNEHLQGHEPNVIQIPSDRFESFPALFSAMKTILSKLVKGLRAEYPKGFIVDKKSQFAIFGVDFLVDEEGRVWLLEANHGPCFPTSDAHPLQSYLYQPFWNAVIEQFVLSCTNSDKSVRLAEFDFLD